MKKSPPFVLPRNFPPHAPLPPGGPWIRPASEEDWDEVTVALPPTPESSARPTVPAAATHAGGPPPLPADRTDEPPPLSLGLGLAPSLTPLSLVENDALRRSA